MNPSASPTCVWCGSTYDGRYGQPYGVCVCVAAYRITCARPTASTGPDRPGSGAGIPTAVISFNAELIAFANPALYRAEVAA
ncbi:MAG TPA: hypothetical protein VFJ16_31260 [Longimicrobium sp.]|nr:hypothetical protein [Longimicrobium sp.]